MIYSSRSSSITEILETAARLYSVDIKCGARVTSIKSVPISPTSSSLPPLSASLPILAIPLSLTPTDIAVSEPLEVTVTSSKKQKSVPKDVTPREPCQFVITYVTSTSAVFDTMKNSRVGTGVVGSTGGAGAEEEEEERRPKEEKSLICDKVIFATGGSRYLSLHHFFFSLFFLSAVILRTVPMLSELCATESGPLARS